MDENTFRQGIRGWRLGVRCEISNHLNGSMLKWQRLLVTAPRDLAARLVLPNCNGASILGLKSKYLHCLPQPDISRNSCNQSLLFLLKSYGSQGAALFIFLNRNFKDRLDKHFEKLNHKENIPPQHNLARKVV